MNRLDKFILALVILGSWVIASRWLVSGNLLFHSDVARDFFLTKEVASGKWITLIGPRSGGVSGWFHGPLWVYANLPAFLLGHGNPVVVGWGWWVGCVLITILIWKLVKNLKFGLGVEWWASALWASGAVLEAHSFNNHQGAMLVAPVFFYTIYRYLNSNSKWWLGWSVFWVGMLIQLQIAFGGPMLLCLVGLSLYKSLRFKKWSNWWVYLVLILPLLSYILFDIRHDFLQSRAMLSNVLSGNGSSWGTRILSRFEGYWLDGWIALVKYKWLNLLLVLALGAQILWKKDRIVKLGVSLYIGFWVFSLLFSGNMVWWYFMPFLGIGAMLVGYLASKYKIWMIIGVLIISLNLVKGIKDSIDYKNDPNKQVETSWLAVKSSVQKMQEMCGSDYGYFVFTADAYGYPYRYAMEYLYPENVANLNKKKSTTCLIMGPMVKENPEGWVKWKKYDLKIDGLATSFWQAENGTRVEKYILTPEEQKIEANPNLIKDAFFR